MTASRWRWRSLLAAFLLVTVPVLTVTRPVGAADMLLVINQVLTDQFPEVAVYLTLTDAAGLPITDVSKDRVQVVHNGQPVSELSLELADSAQDGLAVVVAIDTSGSMKGQPLDYARSAVRLFLEQMGPRDQGAIVSFGQTVQVVQDLTGDREALNRALESLTANGDTALYDGTFQAISLVAKQPLGRRAVIVITDGEDTHSTLTLDDVIARARETSTPVSAIGFGEVLLEPLRRLTLTTGGTLSEAPDPDQISARATRLSELLRKQYVVRYRAPDSRPPENEVEVIINQSGQQARAAQRFPAPAMPLNISLPDLPPGSTVQGQIELRPAIANAERVDRVEYLLDGAPLQTVTEPPYGFTWNSATVPPGEHTLTIRAILGERQAEQTVPLVVAPAGQQPSPSPGPAASGSPAATGSPGAQASPGALGSPGTAASPGPGAATKPGGTPTVTATRTPTPTPTSSSASSLLGRLSPLLLIGLAVAAAVVGGIIFAVSRRSGSAPPGPPYGPTGGTPYGSAGPGDTPALPRALPPAMPPAMPHQPEAEPMTMHDLRESQTQMASALPSQQPAASGPPPQARLTVVVKGQAERSSPLGPDQIIGRSAAPGVIEVADPRVSRRHARISWEDGHFVYRDLGPMNPTRRNGRTLPNPYILRNGDRLAVGESEVVFHM